MTKVKTKTTKISEKKTTDAKKNTRASKSKTVSSTKNSNNSKERTTYQMRLSDEKAKEILKIIVKAFVKKDTKSIRDMYLSYEYLIGLSQSRLKTYFKNKNKNFAFANFLEAVNSEPMSEWFFYDNDKSDMADILKGEIIIDGRRLNESVQEYISSYTNIKAEQQNLIRPMLEELRSDKYNPNNQYVYTLIRDNLVAKNGEFDFELNRPISNVWSKEEMDSFKLKLGMVCSRKYLNTYKFFAENCFDEIFGPITLELCNNCGLPMEYINGEFKCINDMTCRHNKLVENLDRRIIELKAGEKAYVVKGGMGFYITRTGIEETLLFNMLKTKYEPLGWTVIKYPGQDADGDILMVRDDIKIYIDLKEYVSSNMLQKELINSAYQYKSKDIIYIPQYRKELYELKSSLDSLKKCIKKNLQREDGTYPKLAYRGNIIKTINDIIKSKMEGK